MLIQYFVVISPMGNLNGQWEPRGCRTEFPTDRTSGKVLRRMDTADDGGQRIILCFGTLWSICNFPKVLMFQRLDCDQEPSGEFQICLDAGNYLCKSGDDCVEVADSYRIRC